MNQDKLLDGARVAKEIRAEVGTEVGDLARRGVEPRLDVVLVGEDPASEVYVRSKARTCGKLGMISETHRLPGDISQEELGEVVRRLNADSEVDGILVQLPLPGQLDAHAIVGQIDPLKDVDGLHPANVGLLQQGRPRLLPCTPAGIIELLGREGVAISGRRAVVVGRSEIVGKPIAMLLLHAHATVTMCHSRTADLAAQTSQGEILIAAVGRLGLISAGHVRQGAVVVDVGMHRVDDRATAQRLFPDNPERLARFDAKGSVLAGDVDFSQVIDKCARITPVPGGVGPLTIAMLMANVVRAARLRRNL